jgi:hypothetical protein
VFNFAQTAQIAPFKIRTPFFVLGSFSAMKAYQYAIHDDGTQCETLGGMALDNDADAIAFGRRTIRDLMVGDAKHYTGWTMDITQGKRAVGSVLFK